MGEESHDKPDKPDHPHGTPPGHDPDWVPPGHGGTPPGQEPRPTHPIVEPDEEDVPEPEPKD